MRLQSASGMKYGARGNLLAGLKMALYDYKVWLLAFVCRIPGVASAHFEQPDHYNKNDCRGRDVLHTDLGRHI
jgi:hypothetical protein